MRPHSQSPLGIHQSDSHQPGSPQNNKLQHSFAQGQQYSIMVGDIQLNYDPMTDTERRMQPAGLSDSFTEGGKSLERSIRRKIATN